MSLPTRPSADDLSSLSRLSINTSGTYQRSKKKPAPVADSWEEEADDGSDTETEADSGNRLSQSKTEDPPGVPPPTPASPTAPAIPIAAYGPRGEVIGSDPYLSLQPSRERGSEARTPDRRPDKTTAVAARLIAGGLGLRAPKKTEEQREYEKAIRDKEKKKREDERLAKEEAEKAKQSVWED